MPVGVNLRPPSQSGLRTGVSGRQRHEAILEHPAVTVAIPGTGRPDHMKDNLAAGNGPMPDAAARKKMQEYFDSL